MQRSQEVNVNLIKLYAKLIEFYMKQKEPIDHIELNKILNYKKNQLYKIKTQIKKKIETKNY